MVAYVIFLNNVDNYVTRMASALGAPQAEFMKIMGLGIAQNNCFENL